MEKTYKSLTWEHSNPRSNKTHEAQLCFWFHPQSSINIHLMFGTKYFTGIHFNFFNLIFFNIGRHRGALHPAFEVSLNILGIDFKYEVKDKRCWDTDKKRWMTAEEEAQIKRDYDEYWEKEARITKELEAEKAKEQYNN